MQPIRQFIEKYTALSDTDWKKIADIFSQKTIEKDTILLEEGKICKHLYFVETGLLRFYINKDGNDITKFFTEAPYMFTSQVSFTAELPSKENIQAIEKCVLWETTLKQANDLLELHAWNTFVRKLILEVQYYTEEILQEMQTETAENRYSKMLKENPDFLQRIPLKYLASYLGVAAPSLSRIRKNLIDKERT